MSKARILVIDDDSMITKMIQRLLEAEDYEVFAVNCGFEGLDLVENEHLDLILLDQKMPEMDGMATFTAIKKIKAEVPVVFITAEQETNSVIRALDSGALDYIKKPFQPLELVARVKLQLKIKFLQDELRTANAKLTDLVEIDDLTGLFNMRSVYDKIQQEIDRGRRYSQGIGVIMMDMDHFKRVNDDHDHLFGSFVLEEVGKLIRSNVRNVDFGARYGGDEFLICLTHVDYEGAISFANRFREVIEGYHFKQGKDQIRLTSSLGLAVIEEGRSTMDARSLVRMADRSLYEAKESGRNRVVGRQVCDDKVVGSKKLRKANAISRGN